MSNKLITNDQANLKPTVRHLPTDTVAVNTNDGKIYTNQGGVVRDISHKDGISKAEFHARMKEKYSLYAGSGFVDFGESHKNLPNINDGMWVYGGHINVLSLGMSNLAAVTSRGSSFYPRVNIGGVEQHIRDIYSTNVNETVRIPFPVAPNGTETYNPTLDKYEKHANQYDAFGGLLNDASFQSNGTAFWATTGQVTVTNTSGRLSIESTGGGYARQQTTAADMVAGRTYTITGNIYSRTGYSSSDVVLVARTTTQTIVVTDDHVDTDGNFRKDFTYGAGDEYLEIRLQAPSTGHIITFNEVGVHEHGTQVITSRKDLALIESWHEPVSMRDVVYPLGNVQCVRTTHDGISLATTSALGVEREYARFGDWDTGSDGHGLKWSTATEAHRRKMLSDPENNLYYDPELNDYIQVRYRIRVIKGLGNDWYAAPYDTTDITTGIDELMYSIGNRVKPQGMSRIFGDDLAEWSDGATQAQYLHGSYQQQPNGSDIIRTEYDDAGVYRVWSNTSSADEHGYESRCSVIPIAMVQRLNQGVYHPSHNPLGTNLDPSGRVWSHDQSLSNSTASCFTTKGNWGSFSSGSSGRNLNPTELYHDVIYDGQIVDYRQSALRKDPNTVLEQAVHKIIAGDVRGEERLPYTNILPTALNGGQIQVRMIPSEGVRVFLTLSNAHHLEGYRGGSGFTVGRSYRMTLNINNTVLQVEAEYASYTDGGGLLFTNYQTIYGDVEAQEQSDWWHLGTQDWSVMIESDRLVDNASFAKIPMLEVVGHPVNVRAQFPGGFAGRWTPQIPDGNNKTFKFGATVGAINGYATSAGSSWAINNGNPRNFSSVGYSYTDVVAANLVAVHGYSVDARITSFSDRGAPYAIGKVWYGNDSRYRLGAKLVTSLLNKPPTIQTYATNRIIPIESYSVYGGDYESRIKYQITSDEPIGHAQLPDLNSAADDVAVKVMYTLVQKSGLWYVQFTGKEIVTSPNAFFPQGDHAGEILQVDGNVISTDSNSKRILTFNHITTSPIGLV